MSKWLDKEVRDFISDNYRGTGLQELTDLINAEFDINITASKVKAYKGNHHLNSGLTGRFERGHESFNKGRKWTDYLTEEQMKGSRATQFKKGRLPPNTLPVGTEFKRSDGYWYVKVKEPKGWKQKHILLWEKTKGKILKGSCLTFLDGDTDNIALDNLTCISLSENAILNKKNLRFKDKEFTKAGVAVARLENQINKRGK